MLKENQQQGLMIENVEENSLIEIENLKKENKKLTKNKMKNNRLIKQIQDQIVHGRKLYNILKITKTKIRIQIKKCNYKIQEQQLNNELNVQQQMKYQQKLKITLRDKSEQNKEKQRSEERETNKDNKQNITQEKKQKNWKISRANDIIVEASRGEQNDEEILGVTRKGFAEHQSGLKNLLQYGILYYEQTQATYQQFRDTLMNTYKFEEFVYKRASYR
ncbi:unnamed protein product [Paramecium sonneborni]|uniref:Uncharacterized protein n=1 Tax=Paramecium sonneborni TaxID=65129 RepID=A0A8S1LAV3_9CILI|nr:unnamed protein product [Paramecium sonneborni]